MCQVGTHIKFLMSCCSWGPKAGLSFDFLKKNSRTEIQKSSPFFPKLKHFFQNSSIFFPKIKHFFQKLKDIFEKTTNFGYLNKT